MNTQPEANIGSDKNTPLIGSSPVVGTIIYWDFKHVF